MKTVAILQARMGSHRLPGKSMAKLAGKPLLWQILSRVKRAQKIDQLIMATTTKAEDDVLIDLAKSLKIDTFRGPENDLVERYYLAAKSAQADIVVRMCGDNPVLQPSEIDRIIEFHKAGGSDFSSNTHNIQNNGYPDGLGAEVFHFKTLVELREITKDPRNREHPHTYFYEHPEKYRIKTIPCPPEFRRPELKLDVNTPEELAFMQALYAYCYPKNEHFTILDIIKWYDSRTS